MSDYSAAIYGLIAFASVITAGVVYVLAQPSDLPSIKKVRS
ncbi:putative conserved membrane protein [Synechococcus sp. MIT S9220]|nr:putative conserved membrane protein [Synechococcus sp. MIT S9220]